ncbi:hypothetical protein [Azospirillum sp.]|uniref:hypothetical protein n=1 Tax=Azospirillum sp. TaxID=34012 RepID=UPI002D2471EC|nr:hypothetical protein [Azospirillum sp.]HYD64028.1 hypothetical protein [Azospirillum sp.]
MSDVHSHAQIHLTAIDQLEKAIIHHRKAAKHKLKDPHHSAHHAQIALAYTLSALDSAHEAAKVEADEYEKSGEA